MDTHATSLALEGGELAVVIQQSGCFTVVERGAGLDAAMQERDLAAAVNCNTAPTWAAAKSARPITCCSPT